MKEGRVVAEGEPANMGTIGLIELVYGVQYHLLLGSVTGTPILLILARFLHTKYRNSSSPLSP